MNAALLPLVCGHSDIGWAGTSIPPKTAKNLSEQLLDTNGHTRTRIAARQPPFRCSAFCLQFRTSHSALRILPPFAAYRRFILEFRVNLEMRAAFPVNWRP